MSSLTILQTEAKQEKDDDDNDGDREQKEIFCKMERKHAVIHKFLFILMSLKSLRFFSLVVCCFHMHNGHGHNCEPTSWQLLMFFLHSHSHSMDVQSIHANTHTFAADPHTNKRTSRHKHPYRLMVLHFIQTLSISIILPRFFITLVLILFVLVLFHSLCKSTMFIHFV